MRIIMPRKGLWRKALCTHVGALELVNKVTEHTAETHPGNTAFVQEV